jgi:hypothetical protein
MVTIPSLSLSLTHRALMTKLLNPLQTKIEEWKKTAVQMDKEHEKGTCFHYGCQELKYPCWRIYIGHNFILIDPRKAEIPERLGGRILPLVVV